MKIFVAKITLVMDRLERTQKDGVTKVSIRKYFLSDIYVLSFFSIPPPPPVPVDPHLANVK